MPQRSDQEIQQRNIKEARNTEEGKWKGRIYQTYYILK